MKTITTQISALIACAFLSIGGCATTGQNYATPENAHTATMLLSGGILSVLKEPDRGRLACQFYAGAVGVRAFAEGGDHVPTPAELKAAILTFFPNSAQGPAIAETVRVIWQGALPYIGNDVKKGLVWAEAIATGFEITAKPYCGGPLGTPIHQPTPVADFSPKP